ncbi:cell division protein FtsW [Candidatus Hydrogenosomobacter endosymbioticus]|uniref:Probable peptidoglycan glycosyltransferase FtsW n=2 Tax=Candidatus Hydrogenosomobacter endosymbioticus TaxID=2558174 RepID=A0ABN6L2Z5_9PROT|nr:cell division protein FtsW [Candidatus Hydrogenosomobacter endosymbioticus]
MSVSPVVAIQHGWSPFVLLKKHFIVMFPGLMVMMCASMMKKEGIIMSSILIAVFAWIALWLVFLFGSDIKGARRWISVCGFSLQPSEFLKTASVVLSAWLFTKRHLCHRYASTLILIFVMIFPLLLQPDIGMVFLITSVWFVQCFVAGLPIAWFAAGALFGVGAVGVAYCCFSHVAARINSFLFSGGCDKFGIHYQVIQALSAFSSGGWFGKGPGAGVVLNSIPDGHSDFIFAVAAEEFGMILCVIIILLYGIIVFRSLLHAMNRLDKFYSLACVGIAMQLLIQTFLNMGSVMRMIPTKGTTLPFVSYGGSSFLSLCFAMGVLLSLTRRQIMDIYSA